MKPRFLAGLKSSVSGSLSPPFRHSFPSCDNSFSFPLAIFLLHTFRCTLMARDWCLTMYSCLNEAVSTGPISTHLICSALLRAFLIIQPPPSSSSGSIRRVLRISGQHQVSRRIVASEHHLSRREYEGVYHMSLDSFHFLFNIQIITCFTLNVAFNVTSYLLYDLSREIIVVNFHAT